MVASVLPLVGASLRSSSVAPLAESAASATAPGEDAAAFSQALHVQRASDVAASPLAAPGLGSHVSAGLQEVSSKLAAWHVPGSVGNETASTGLHGTPGSAIPDALTSAMTEAVTGLQGAYVFAIQATLVSRGSTEGTKILNTLLKGQ